MAEIKTASIIGCGVIGAGWVARLIENGVDVRVFDPGEEILARLESVLTQSRRAVSKLTDAPRHPEGSFEIVSSIAEAVEGVDLIVESVPERLEIKQAIYQKIESGSRIDAVVTSSTSGLLPSRLQEGMAHPERFLVAHPFNPVYLIPLVELVGGRATDKDVIEGARRFFDAIGMVPLHVKKEIEGFIADRLLEAMWREALWLVKDGIATTREIDDAVRFGFGLRYAQMGIFDTYRIAGGEAGMRHFLSQFGPCLKWPWTKLMDVPEMNDAFIDRIARQSDEQSGHLSIDEMERIRDDNLIALMHGLKSNGWGAGKTLAAYEERLFDRVDLDRDLSDDPTNPAAKGVS
jgi:carnitine 3-dehydrogenase